MQFISQSLPLLARARASYIMAPPALSCAAPGSCRARASASASSPLCWCSLLTGECMHAFLLQAYRYVAILWHFYTSYVVLVDD